MASSVIGWFGPAIDLSDASSHVGGFVQLLVFVHRSIPLQYKLSKGGEIVRTDFQVGDHTRPRFTVSLWQKQMGSLAMSGDVILLQNVKITKFGDVVSARTVQYSSLVRLIHPFDLVVSKGVDELIGNCQVTLPTRERLRKVIEWVKTTRSIPHNIGSRSCQRKLLSRNWKVLEQGEHKECFSLSEVLGLKSSCRALFQASVGEIFLPLTHKVVSEDESERMFISWRLNSSDYSCLTDDFVCIGCQLCGSPLDMESNKQNPVPLHCEKSSDRLHVVGLIYRPFMLYVWDELEYIPLIVKNKAAEVLFGNIRADRVYQCHTEKSETDHCRMKASNLSSERPSNGWAANDGISAAEKSGKLHCKLKINNLSGEKLSNGSSAAPCTSADEKKASDCRSGVAKAIPEEEWPVHKDVNFLYIWLILLKLLLQQGKNSPLKFEIGINPSLNMENGRFELISLSMPCPKTK